MTMFSERLSRIAQPTESSKKMRAGLVIATLLHLAIAVAHGAAHDATGIQLGPAGLAFVVVVIIFGPMAGLLWMWRNPRAGARLIAVTMTGALLFGLINHFVIPGPDRVDSAAAASSAWFTATAALLAISEAAGAALGAAYGWRRRSY